MTTRNRLLSLGDERVLRHLPGHKAMKFRIQLLRKRGAYIGKNVFIGTGVRILNPQALTIKDNAVITRDVLLDARGGLTIHDHALIGFESILLTRTHVSDQVGIPIQHQGSYESRVEIGARTWMGARSVILPGVNIPADSIVASAAVVNRSFSSRGIFGGVPAQLIKIR